MLKTIILEDNNTPTGGTSFANETLEDFLLSINAMPKQPLDDADKWHIDQLLSQNGIKPVFNVTKSDAFITLYKRLFDTINTYCDKHELYMTSNGLSKNKYLITDKKDYKDADCIDLDIEAPSGSSIYISTALKPLTTGYPLTTDYNTIEDYIQEQLKAIIKNIKDAAHNFNADDTFRDLWTNDYYLTPSEFLHQLQKDEEFLHEFAKQKD